MCGRNKLTLNRQGAAVEGLACCRPASREAGCCHVTREKVETVEGGHAGTRRYTTGTLVHSGTQVKLIHPLMGSGCSPL